MQKMFVRKRVAKNICNFKQHVWTIQIGCREYGGIRQLRVKAHTTLS